jgi:prepilin signal peptidase PulO-like enzyme (type II secretory pathway)
MQAQLLTALIGALAFAVAGLCGTLIATALIPALQPFEDGPPPYNVHPALLIAGAAVLGGFIGWREPPLLQFAVSALSTVVLVAIWYCDARTGFIPDWLTLLPLGLLLIYGVARHDWLMLISAAVMFVPFAFIAFISKGRGMGWGDAKLASLGGALVGMEMAAFGFTIATAIAVIVTRLRGHPKDVPIALGPYLVCAIAVAIVLQT